MLGVNNSHCSNIRHTVSIARPSNTAEMLCNEIGGIFSTLPLELSQFTNIKYLIGSITCGVSSNRQGIDAFSNRLTMLFLSLKQHRPTASVDVYISDVVALISSVERFFVGHSAKNQLRQSLFTHAVSEQLETFDTIMMTLAKSMKLPIVFVEPTVHLASQLDIKDIPSTLVRLSNSGIENQFMETLSDISSFNIDIFPPDIAELLQGLLCRVADQIKQRTGRSLSERKRWSIDSGEISEALQEAVNDYRIQTRSYKAIWNGHEVVVNPIWGINNLESASLLEREADEWHSLNHPNILRMFGLCLNADIPLVVTAAIYTNLESFLKLSAGIDSTARSKYVIGISNGMKYLHTLPQPIVHGYLKAVNVLIGLQGEILISGFGLPSLNQFSPQCTDHIRWMAPERYAHDYISSPALDVFAFAMTCYEIYTGLIPFYEQPNKHIVQGWINNGERPYRHPTIPDIIWTFMQRCWSHDPLNRPKFTLICLNLSCLSTSRFDSISRPLEQLLHKTLPPLNCRPSLEMATPFREIQSGGHSTLQISPFLHSSKSSDFSQKLDFRNDGFNSSPQAEATEIARLCQDRPKNSRLDLSLFDTEGSPKCMIQSPFFHLDEIIDRTPSHSPRKTQSVQETDTTVKGSFLQNINTIGDRMKGGTIEQESTTNGIEANRQSNKILNYANIVKVSTSSNAPTSALAALTISPKCNSISPVSSASSNIGQQQQHPPVASELAIYTKEFHVLNVAFPFWIQKYSLTASKLSSRVCHTVDVWDPTCRNFAIKPSLEWHNNGNLSVIRFPLSNINRLLHSSIFRLTNLSELALHRSGLNGQIPKDICRLVNLKRLDLGANCFDGSIPKEIGLLVKLEQLSLHKNSFSDSIPKEFGSLVEMKWLRLDHNKLSGKIPKEIGNMTKLIQLCIDGNVMSRDIPAQIFEISNLREL
ncbi:hypothetical protein BASA83_010695 [Batrachochytrium salamandrivorans]|nr:hypothetical protein BASA83_010695 [Batrachochytrium salamandrivorans]